MKKKHVALLLATSLCIGGVIGGSLAWFIDQTETIENVFTVGNIDISLDEDLAPDGSDLGDDSWEGKMIPGSTLTKDPKVTVEEGSEDCWLFVKVVEERGALPSTGEFTDYLDYKIADGWTELTDVAESTDTEKIYWRKVSADEAGKAYSILKDDKVEVSEDITKEMMDVFKKTKTVSGDANGDGVIADGEVITEYVMENGQYVYDADKFPTLSFIAYAVQQANIADNAKSAWETIFPPADGN